MKKPFIGLYALYVMLLLYGIIFSWFLYVGPYTTKKIAGAIQRVNQRVVISLTTTPYRINHIKPTLDSLRAQSIQADAIYLNIPYVLQRANLDYVLPDWLLNYPGITIKRSVDYGPATKLIPTLDLERDPRTIIITVDDDVIYPRQMVRDLVQHAMQNPRVVATPLHVDFKIANDYVFTNIKYKFKHKSRSHLVIGAAGVAYRRSFFGADFMSTWAQLPAVCALADDLVISIYLAQQNIAIEQTLKNSFNPLVTPFTYKEMPYKNTADALSFANGELSGNQRNYAACLQQIYGASCSVVWLTGLH